MNKLLLVDGNAVLHRAYHALPDWRNRSGEATAGVYGFLSMLLGAIEQLKPTHLAIVFDTPAPTFRHNMYVGYQSNREKNRQVSEDIWGQVEKLKTVFDKLEVPVYTLPGFEADDVIGTLSSQCKMDNAQCTIITGDKDLMQLVDEHTFLFMPQKGFSDNILVDEAKVIEKLGVHPKQVIDYKALVGDGSDNYPGVTGIGPKTAIELLSKFENFENVYQKFVNNAPSDPPLNTNQRFALRVRGGGGLVKKLVDGYEGGKLSKELATIRRDAPISLEIEKCTLPEKQKFTDVFKELNYRSLASRSSGVKELGNKSQIGLFDM